MECGNSEFFKEMRHRYSCSIARCIKGAYITGYSIALAFLLGYPNEMMLHLHTEEKLRANPLGHFHIVPMNAKSSVENFLYLSIIKLGLRGQPQVYLHLCSKPPKFQIIH